MTKMTLWIVIIVHPRSTKQSPSTIGRRRDHLGSFLHSQEIFNFIWLSFSILLKHFIFFSNLNSFGRVLHFQSLQRSTNDFCNSKFCKLFFFKVNETDWSRDFKFFLFARFSHNQPLLFLLIPHSPTITFKTMFHCPQHLVKFLRNSISTHTHKIVVDFKMSRKMLKCQKVGSRKHFEIIPQKKLHIQFTV